MGQSGVEKIVNFMLTYLSLEFIVRFTPKSSIFAF